MNRPDTARRIGAGPDLQALLSYAYAVQCFRARQQQALTKLAWHALEAVPGQSLAIGTIQKQQLRWVAAVSQANGHGAQLALPQQISDLELTSFGLELSGAEVDGQYPVHVYQGAGDVPSTAYVLIGKGQNVVGVLAVCRYTDSGFGEHDLRLLRIFGMSVEQVLGWVPNHPTPEGLRDIALYRNEAVPILNEPPSAFFNPDELRDMRLFEVHSTASRSFGLKVGMSLMTLTLAGLGMFGAYSRQTGKVSPANLQPRDNRETSAVTQSSQEPAAAISIPSTTSVPDAAPDGLRVVNPDPGVTIWEPTRPTRLPVALNRVHLRKQKDQLFMIFELSGDTGLKIEHFTKPDRVVVHFAGAKVPKHITLRGNDPLISAFSARSSQKGAVIQVKLSRHANVVLVGPTSEHHVILNLQG